MAVTFNKESFSIDVKTDSFSVDNWKYTVDELIELLMVENPEKKTSFFVLQLLKEMMPDVDLANKMFDDDSDCEVKKKLQTERKTA